MWKTGWRGGVIENGPYNGPLPTSNNEVWVTAVIFFNGVVIWQITSVNMRTEALVAR